MADAVDKVSLGRGCSAACLQACMSDGGLAAVSCRAAAPSPRRAQRARCFLDSMGVADPRPRVVDPPLCCRQSCSALSHQLVLGVPTERLAALSPRCALLSCCGERLSAGRAAAALWRRRQRGRAAASGSEAPGASTRLLPCCATGTSSGDALHGAASRSQCRSKHGGPTDCQAPPGLRQRRSGAARPPLPHPCRRCSAWREGLHGCQPAPLL